MDTELSSAVIQHLPSSHIELDIAARLIILVMKYSSQLGFPFLLDTLLSEMINEKHKFVIT